MLDALISVPAVASFMRRDLCGHIANVRASQRDIPQAGGATLQGIVRHALATHEHSALARKTGSMVGGVLWLNRATTFIAAFLRGLADGRASHEAARAAYDGTLRQYHRAITAAFVSRAVGLCPPRSKIIDRLRLPGDGAEQVAILRRFLALLEPLTGEIRAFLEGVGANFSNRIG